MITGIKGQCHVFLVSFKESKHIFASMETQRMMNGPILLKIVYVSALKLLLFLAANSKGTMKLDLKFFPCQKHSNESFCLKAVRKALIILKIDH